MKTISDTSEEMPYNATIRPLMTFKLFAYNHREAVKGVFEQADEPLEIILSDDCSSDSTYQIMQEMAVTFHGPHQDSFVHRAAKRGHMTRVTLFRGPIHQHSSALTIAAELGSTNLLTYGKKRRRSAVYFGNIG
jgi:glycosyltransferase involved in cell wall biosynthesis|tara:strand:+ start:126 stop:527 length:402 start_codon:yes stop_codon:yes gene_type:complete